MGDLQRKAEVEAELANIDGYASDNSYQNSMSIARDRHSLSKELREIEEKLEIYPGLESAIATIEGLIDELVQAIAAKDVTPYRYDYHTDEAERFKMNILMTYERLLRGESPVKEVRPMISIYSNSTVADDELQ